MSQYSSLDTCNVWSNFIESTLRHTLCAAESIARLSWRLSVEPWAEVDVFEAGDEKVDALGEERGVRDVGVEGL